MQTEREWMERYSRQILLPQVGGSGQKMLAGASVGVVGAGAIASPFLLYLAGAGFGKIGLVDCGEVKKLDPTCMGIHAVHQVGWPRGRSVAEALSLRNPQVSFETWHHQLNVETALPWVSRWDWIVDTSNQTSTRTLLNRVCQQAAKPLLAAWHHSGVGWVASSRAVPGSDFPCLACFSPPQEKNARASSPLGGLLKGLLGSLLAERLLCSVLEIGPQPWRFWLHFTANTGKYGGMTVHKDLNCRICGQSGG